MESSSQLGIAPGPSGVLGLLGAFGYMRRPLDGMTRIRRRFGPVAALRMPGAAMILVSDPELVEKVLTDGESYRKDIFMQRMGKDLLGAGLLTSDGDVWRRQRRLVQPAFHQARIAEYATVMGDCAERYVSSLEVGEERDVHADMMKLTLQVVLRTLLSMSSAHAVEEISEAMAVITAHYDIGFQSSVRMLWGLPMPGDRAFRRAVRRIDEIFLEIVRERRSRARHDAPADVLDMLLAARDERGEGISDAQLRDEVVTMFLAGHETTALALAYSFACLSWRPDAAQALSAELEAVLGGRAPVLADLPSLPYTEAVVLEAMRLYPPAWSIGREATRDTELGGYRIPKGTQVLVSQWVLHRDPDTFPEPEAFRPERWLDGLKKRLHRCAYMPFGGGPRKCIGSTFAMIEAPLLLATIARRYRLKVEEPREPLRFLLSVTLRPRGGLRAHVQPR